MLLAYSFIRREIMRPNRVLSSVVVVVVGSALSRQKFVHVVDWIGGPVVRPLVPVE